MIPRLLPLENGSSLLLGGHAGGATLKYVLMRHLIEGGLREGRLRRGGVVAELSAGASAVALAQVAHEEGLRALVFVPTTMEPALLDRLKELDAEVVAAPPSPQSIRDALTRLLAMHERGEAWWTRQNYNPLAQSAYEPLARAVLARMPPPSVLVAGIGTGGVLHSFGTVLGQANPALRLVGIHSGSISGLRAPEMRFDLADLGLSPKAGPFLDLGSRSQLRRQFGRPLELVEREREQVQERRASLAARGVSCGDSTAAVVGVIEELELKNALGVSIDGQMRGGLAETASL